MNQALWVAKTGLDAQQTRMSVVSNNLANTNTTGFKRDRASFEDLLYQQVRQPGGSTSSQTQLPSGLQLGTGVRVVSTSKDFQQGNPQQTGRSLDVMVNGRGFFEVLLPDGSPAYTRDGSFQINAQGELVTNAGYAVQPGIQIPEGAQSISIGSDGTITVTVAGQNWQTMPLQACHIKQPERLVRQEAGSDLFREGSGVAGHLRAVEHARARVEERAVVAAQRIARGMHRVGRELQLPVLEAVEPAGVSQRASSIAGPWLRLWNRWLNASFSICAVAALTSSFSP